MLKTTAICIALWTFFFFVAIIIEEVSLVLWNGYSLSLAARGDQVTLLPVIFVLGMIAAGSVLPFFIKLPRPQKLRLMALSLAFWAALLLVPVTREMLRFFLPALLLANWWHPIQSAASWFWALLPLPAAAIASMFAVQYEQANFHWVRPLGAAGAVLLILLMFSGRDNSVCLGEWDANFSPLPQSNPSAVHLVSLHLDADCKGHIGRGYVMYHEPPDSLAAMRYRSLFCGDVRWAQTRRTLRIYNQKLKTNVLIAEGTVSPDAETISLHFTHPDEAIVFRRYQRK